MNSEGTIDYEALAQDAMRNVVRTVLTEAAERGLPGDHHFYISFDTLAPGVILSKRLREQYAEEMTIVLQHRFWDLIVNEQRFEVKLTFNGIPERLVVPFKAIKVFFDPSVRYGLQFDTQPLERAIGPETRTRPKHDREPVAQRRKKDERPAATAPAGSSSLVPAHVDETPAQLRPQIFARQERSAERESKPEPDLEEVHDAAPDAEDQAAEAARGAQIVSLDAFRKK